MTINSPLLQGPSSLGVSAKLLVLITFAATILGACLLLARETDKIFAQPVAFDSESECLGGTANGFTWDHTVNAGSNRLLLVGVSFMQPAGQTVEDVTFNGDAMSLVGSSTNEDGDFDLRVEIWSLASPDVVVDGDVAVDLTGTGTTKMACGAASFFNVDQTTPLDAPVPAQGDDTGTSASVTVTSAVGDTVFDAIVVDDDGALTPGAGQNEHWDDDVAGVGDDVAGAGSSSQAGAASVTNSWTIGDDDDWAMLGVNINQDNTVAPTPTVTATPTDGGGSGASIDFSQCRNDSDNNEAIDNCEWTNGAVNQSNSLYTEGDAVPQRLFHSIDAAGAHTMRFRYEFTKADIYGYDFITNVDGTMAVGVSGLNECADLPSFVSAGVCSTLFSGPDGDTSLAPVPSDLFDAVSSRENPPGAGTRNFRVGCSPACSVAATVIFPDINGGEVGDVGESHLPDSNPDCFQDCGDSDVAIEVTFTTASPNTVVGVWFAGHLAEAADPTGTPFGWGAGFGASSVSGSSFHIGYVAFDGASIGERNNQIQPGGVIVPPPPTATASVTATATYTLTPTPPAPETPSPTATETPSPTATETPSPTATETPSPTATETPSPSPTETVTATPTCQFVYSDGGPGGEVIPPGNSSCPSPTPTATTTATATVTRTSTPLPVTVGPTPTITKPPADNREPGMAILVHSNTAKTKLVCGHGAPNRICNVPAGATFSIDIKTDRGPAQGFQGYQVLLQYRNLQFSDQNGLAENRWPRCPNYGSDQDIDPSGSTPGRYTLICKGPPPPTTYKGVLANIHFTCNSGLGQIILVGGAGAHVSFYDKPSIFGNRIFLPPVPVPPLGGGANVNAGDAVRIQCGVNGGQVAGETVDSDGDGCSDKQEAGRRVEFGGLRDAYNSWDFFDPTYDQRHRIDDVLAVALRSGLDTDATGYSAAYDRTVAGPGFWQLGPGNGVIDQEDAAIVAGLYRQDCTVIKR